VLLFGKDLASFAHLDEVFSVGHGRGPVKSRSVRLSDKVVHAACQPHSLL
jgi:hypothetical protein